MLKNKFVVIFFLFGFTLVAKENASVLYVADRMWEPYFHRVKEKFAEEKITAFFESDVKKIQLESLWKYTAVVLRTPKILLEKEFSGSALEKYTKGGGTVFICLDSKNVDLFSDFRIARCRPKISETSVALGIDWLSRQMKWYCRKLYPPVTGLVVPASAGWHNIFVTFDQNGETLPCLVAKPVGKGRLFLTTAPCGLIEKGWNMLLFGHHMAESFVEFLKISQFNNIFSRVKENESEYGSEAGIVVQRITEPPMIDGKLDDDIYRKAEWSSPFLSLGKESETVHALQLSADEKFQRLQTVYSLFTDGKSLIAAFKAPVSANVSPASEGKWGKKDDFVELFFTRDGVAVHQILIDCNGNMQGLFYEGTGTLPKKWELDGVRSAVASGKKDRKSVV